MSEIDTKAKAIFDLYINQCRDPYDGSLCDQQRVLDAMEAGIKEAYTLGLSEGRAEATNRIGKELAGLLIERQGEMVTTQLWNGVKDVLTPPQTEDKAQGEK